MNVTAKNSLLEIATEAVALTSKGYGDELKSIGITVDDYRLPFDNNKHFIGSVSIGDVRLTLTGSGVRIELPLRFGEENLPSVVREFSPKMDNLKNSLEEIKNQRKESRRKELEEELAAL